MEFNPEVFDVAAGFQHWLLVFALFAGVLLLLGLVVCLLTRGFKGIELFGTAVVTSLKDLAGISLKRSLAIARLTFKEAIRRKALLVFVVFCIVFMFAGWFLASGGEKPQLQVKLYVSFVLTSISWLLLVVMLLLSCWGIPEDIRLRSLHTVVTKPTRRIEIVMGRIIGFSSIGVLVLAVMSVAGYIWINRQLTPAQKEVLTCRVPVYAPLEFLNDQGQPDESGVNVGDMWKFRSYIAGASRARGIWTFEDLDSRNIGDDGLRLESNFEAFRTHKGNMDTGGLVAQYTLVNNRRAEAFAAIAASNNFQTAANELRLGRYQTAADGFRGLGNAMLANDIEFAKGELDGLADAFNVASDTILNLDDVGGESWVLDLTKAFGECLREAQDSAGKGQAAADYTRL
ncbi:MAG: ABC transporter permease, partial [Planctomycetaceae bacterium]